MSSPATARAFTEVVRRHDDRLRGLAYKLLGGDRDRMDDVLQEAYIRAFRALGTFRRDAHLGSWLYRIVYNACIDELRRSKRRPAPVDITDATWDRTHRAPAPSGPSSPPTPPGERWPPCPTTSASPS